MGDEGMQTIISWFEQQVQERPFTTALIVDNNQYNYQTLNDYADSIKQVLIDSGLIADSPVGLCTKRSLEQVIGMLGILKAGGGYLPLEPTLPLERLLTIIQESRVSILLIDSAYQAFFKDYQGIIICLDRMHPKNHQIIPSTPLKPNYLAYIIYTSGSTGVPKGVLIEHASVVNYARWFADYTKVSPSLRIDWSTPFIFDMAVTTSIVSLMLGLTVVLCSDAIKCDPCAYLKYIQTNSIHIIKITPSFFKALLHEVHLHPLELPHLQTIILGGENLPMADCRAWRALYPQHRLFNEYGPTEATIAVSQYQLVDAVMESTATYAPIGKSGTNMQCYILDDTLNIVAPNQLGELYIAGACLARGYNHQQELTQKKFIHHEVDSLKNERLYRTGDLCRMQADGTMECVGRIDNQVKIRGYRIEISEIEQYLSAFPGIESSAVIIRQTVRNELQLLAYYIVTPGKQPINSVKLREYLQQYLPHYMIPAAFIAIDAFPVTANGKLNPSALPQPFINPSVLKPRTKMQKQLAAIWQKELDVRSIGIEDNFYELGGHSLNAARIVSQINKITSKTMTLAEFYQANNIAELAKLIKKAPKAKEIVPLLPAVQSSDNIPLSDFQLLLWFCKTFEPKAQKMNIVARKRLHGTIDSSWLNQAFNAVLATHPILNIQISRLYPAQRLGNQHLFTINEIDLQPLTPKQQESELIASFEDLIHLHPWPLDKPLFTAKLFHLDVNTIEIHVCLAHFIADEASMDIFLNDLTDYYHQYQQNNTPVVIKKSLPFEAFIREEQKIMTTFFDEDYAFWREYLSTGGLYSFPDQFVEQLEDKKTVNYTTYYPIHTNLFGHLEHFCSHNHIGLEEVLCAAVSIALKKQGYNYYDKNSPMIVNLIKSTRNDPAYDQTIGCFIRVDPVKVDLSESTSLLTISKQVKESITSNQVYQRASTLLKLACCVAQDCKRTLVKSMLTQVGIFLYQKALNHLKLNYDVLNLIHNLADFNRDKHFVIYINVWSNFVKRPVENETILGLKTMTTSLYQYEISRFDNVCDISFLADEYNGTRYVTISGNLKQTKREAIAQEIVNLLQETIGKRNPSC